MKIKYLNQIRTDLKAKYSFSESFIKIETFRLTEEEGEYTESLVNVRYINLLNIDRDKIYILPEEFNEIKVNTEDELELTLVNHIVEDSEKIDENFIEEVEFEDFEIPEDAEIIQLEELIIPEPEPSPVDNLVRENAELKRSVDSLRSSMIQSNKNTEDLIVTLLAMM